MLPFTQERLTILGNVKKDIFYYNRKSLIPEVYLFSKAIHDDLKNYLGIEFEIKQRIKLSEAVSDDGDQRFYDGNKIVRIELLYDFYVEYVLKTMQILYYELFDEQSIYNNSLTISGKIQTLFTTDGTAQNQVLQAFNDGIQNDQIIDLFNENLGKTKNDSSNFLLYFEHSVKKSGRRLSDCFKQALEKCQPIKTMIEQQINIEFPIKTLQDKVVEKEKIVVSKKKAK